MKKIILLIILSFIVTLVSSSCSSETNTYTKLVAEWQGRKIRYPNIMIDATTGDTVYIEDADFTILTYIDSAGCTECKMKLPIWKEFLVSLDSVVKDAEFNAVIVVNTKETKELSYLIRRDDYPYLIINDTTDSLRIINQFPDNAMFHTFLLDRNNNVIAIGNPTYNNAVAEMFRAIISGRKTFNNSGTQMIEVCDYKKDVAKVKLGEMYTFKYTLNNESLDTVYVRDIISSCHCTQTFIPDRIIPPKGTREVQVKFCEDSVVGEFYSLVYVYYQGFENPTVLEISGTVIN